MRIVALVIVCAYHFSHPGCAFEEGLWDEPDWDEFQDEFPDAQHPPLNTAHVEACPPGETLEFHCLDGSHGPKDGLLDESEMTHRNILYLNIVNMDRNNDGRVSAREAVRYSMHQRAREEVARKREHDQLLGGRGFYPHLLEPHHHHHPGPQFQHHYDHELPQVPHHSHAHLLAKTDIAQYDANKDGKLDTKEYAVFRRRDEVAREELRESHEQAIHRHMENRESDTHTTMMGNDRDMRDQRMDEMSVDQTWSHTEL